MDRSAEEPLVPLSSDECGQSGVDSDEDVITDYLPLAVEPSRALSPTDADVMAHLQRGSIGPTTGIGGVGGPLVPTISVTPHSPAAKHYPVLEDSLQQLHEIHESIQAMRELSCAASAAYGIGFGGSLRLTSVARLSASCPSLNEAANGGIHGCSDPMLDSQGSVGSSPLHMPGSRKSSETQDWLLCRGLQGDTQRRRSWTALEDLSGTKEKVKQNRQRSMSLSSMESEADESSLLDNVDGSTARLLCTDPAITRRGRNSSGGGASTHSLNEADLQNDFNKLKAKREAEQRLLSARLPLQKSVSTPSIIAVRDIAPEPLVQPTLPMCRPSGTEESETEEEGSRQGSALGHFDIPSAQLSLHHLLEHAPYDHHSEKRRKRGSLFFRKKKDKSKKVSHQWVSACYGSSHICDWCSKPLSNKPALYCETCTTTVHQNTCKDNIVDCNKPKLSKNSAKLSGFSVSIPNSKSSLTKRGSSATTQNSSSNSQIINEDKEIDHHHHYAHHDSASFADDVPIVPLEFLTETPLTAADLGSDPCLGLHESEPDSWTPAVGKDIARKLKEKEVKRQEHIYEFILTEKHHCLTLLTMQKVFVDGLQKYFQLGPNLERMFPRLVDLTALHLGLLSRLRERQREAPIVTSIADILLEQFSSQHAMRLKSAYGEFCSRHRDAVDIYKYYLQHDARFGQFVRHCQTIPLLKKKGIPECILFVTQRLTKYPLLIEPLIKTSKDNKEEQEMLQKALALVKEILVEVDAQVAEKEKEDRKLEIYNRIDAKSYTTHRGHKFKKSDILQGNRALKFEGVAMLMQGRGKMQVVLVIVLSDVLFFLQENSHKYSFFTPDNKAGVVSLQKLLVREKAGQESRGIYLISSNPADPEMFELKVHKPKDKQLWIQAIRAAVQSCPEDEEDNIALSSEERQKLLNAKQAQVRHLVGMLRQKDEEQAILLEEKMALQLRLLAAAGLDPPSPPPTYRHLVSEHADTGVMWKEVLSAVQEVSQLASSLYASGTNLSRSVSSVGEHQSDTYVSPTLPKRAETFGGFDNAAAAAAAGGLPLNKLINKKLQQSSGSQAGSPCDTENLKPGDSKLFERLPWRNAVLATVPPGVLNETSAHDVPALLTLGREQQVAAVQLSHYVYTLLCIISQLMTSVDSLQSQLTCYKSNHGSGSGAGGAGSDVSGDGRKPQYRPNQQLEELRNLQDKLSAEKANWQQVRDQEQRDLDDKKQELLRLQEQIRAEQSDITQQREQLYRKMEILTNQGFLISPNVALPVGVPSQSHDEVSPPEEVLSSPSLSSPQTSDHSPTTNYVGTEPRRKEGKWAKGATKSTLPLNLISATNQPKAQNIPIKQQLPLKLASRLSSSGSITPTGGMSGPPTQQQQCSSQQQQQMLPLRLQEDKSRRSSGGSGGSSASNGGYQRLGSGNFSPPSTTNEPLVSVPLASHSRTGSSPAMMQATTCNNSTPGIQHPASSSSNSSSGTKAMRTHTYPKLPDKFRVRSPEQPPPDEEVIFF